MESEAYKAKQSKAKQSKAKQSKTNRSKNNYNFLLFVCGCFEYFSG